LRSWKPSKCRSAWRWAWNATPALALACVLGGCGGGSEWFPLEVGRSWTYTVRTGYVTYVESVRVERSLSVAGKKGYELAGPMGRSRVAWSSGVLRAESLPNARFDPPLPILIADGLAGKRTWSGSLESPEGRFEAKATLEQSPESIRVGVKRFDAVKTRVLLRYGGRRIEALTWYARDAGPVRQEQRTDGDLDVAMELLGGQ